jgi:tetratricopeptide (TPR) repeat protein
MTRIKYKFLLIPIITTLLLGVSSAKANTISDIATMSIKCIDNPEDVEQKYHDAISEHPNFAHVYNNRGEAKIQIGDCNGARIDFGRAIYLDSKFAQSYINRGLLDLTDYKQEPLEKLKGLFNGSSSTEQFSRALSIDPSYIKGYEQIVASYPNSADAYAFRGIGRYIIKNLDGSLSDFDRAIKIEPNNYLFYHYRSSIKYALEDKTGSKKDKIRADKLFASQNRVGTRGASNAAIYGALSVPIQLDPNNTKAYWRRAEARFAMYGKGREDYLRVIELQPNNPYAYYKISESFRIHSSKLESQEDIEAIAKADEYLAKAKELIVDNAEVMSLDDFDPNSYIRADIREALGDIEGAKVDRARIKK